MVVGGGGCVSTHLEIEPILLQGAEIHAATQDLLTSALHSNLNLFLNETRESFSDKL